MEKPRRRIAGEFDIRRMSAFKPTSAQCLVGTQGQPAGAERYLQDNGTAWKVWDDDFMIGHAQLGEASPCNVRL